jgi:hypothetical protein
MCCHHYSYIQCHTTCSTVRTSESSDHRKHSLGTSPSILSSMNVLLQFVFVTCSHKKWTVFLILKYFIKQYFTGTNDIIMHYVSQGVRIAELVAWIGYRLGNCGILVQFPAGMRLFCSHWWGSWDVKLITHLHLVPRQCMYNITLRHVYPTSVAV